MTFTVCCKTPTQKSAAFLINPGPKFSARKYCIIWNNILLESISVIKTKWNSETQKLIMQKELEQVDSAPSHIPAPAPSLISLHIKIPNAFL